MRSALLVLLTLVLAGCASPAAEPEAQPTTPPTLADDAAADAEAATPAADEADAEDAVAAPIVLQYEGNTGTGVAACAGPLNTCDAVTAVETEQAWFTEVESVVTRVSLTMTWTPASPATNTMTVGASYGPDGSRNHVWASGASPLTFELTDVTLGPADMLEVWGFPTSEGNLDTVWVSVDQAFTLDAVLTTR